MTEKRKRGRPKSPPRPKPVSWRPKTQDQRDKYLALGGAYWMARMVDKAETEGFYKVE